MCTMHVFVLSLALPAQELQPKQNQLMSFVSNPHGSHTGTSAETDDELDESTEASKSKHARTQQKREGKHKSL